MNSFQLIVSTFVFLSLWTISTTGFPSFNRHLAKLVMDVDRSVIKTNAQCPLECVAKCHQRQRCKFFRALVRMKGFMSLKCSLDLNPGEKSDYFTGHTCKETADLVYKYPTALAGACSDHRCNATQVCEPLEEGGYRCTTEQKHTRRSRRRHRGRKSRRRQRGGRSRP